MTLFFFLNLILLLSVYFHTSLSYVVRRVFCNGQSRALRQNGATYSDDFYRECSFLQLYYEWTRMCEEEVEIKRAETSKKEWRKLNSDQAGMYKLKLQNKKIVIQNLCSEYFRNLNIKDGSFEDKMAKCFGVNDRLSLLRKTEGARLGI
jgi:hypothetical protein